MQKKHKVLKMRLLIFALAAFIRVSLEPPRFLQIRLRHESRDKYVIHISKTAFKKMLF